VITTEVIGDGIVYEQQ